MLQEERYIKIVELLKEEQTARYSEIAKYLDTSENTVRKDLQELEKKGVLKIVRGGAVWGKNDLTRGLSTVRSNINVKEKEELVTGLGNILENGQAISMNGGTTTIEAAKYIVNNYSRMTIITNNMTVAEILKANKDFHIIITGGIYNKGEEALYGSRTKAAMDRYNTDYALIAVNCLSLEKGLTDFRDDETDIINTMIKNASTSVILADHTKFEKVACMNICPISEVDYVLTDSKADEKILKKYKAYGVNIMTAEQEI